MILYCIRHGSTAWTDEARYTGTSNPPLTQMGRQEAQATASYLTGLSFDAAISSPLMRCRETCEIISQYVQLCKPPCFDRRAQEIFYGEWEGKTRAELLASNPTAFDNWDRDPTLTAPPGGESVAMVWVRLESLLSELLTQNLQRVLLVSHRTVLRILVAQALNIPLGLYRQRLDHAPAAVTVLDLKSPREGKLLLYNYSPLSAKP